MEEEKEIRICKENMIDIVSAIMAAGVVVNTSAHEEHVDATLRYYYEFKNKIGEKEGTEYRMP